jgi:hypothetical protein
MGRLINSVSFSDTYVEMVKIGWSGGNLYWFVELVKSWGS